MVLLWLTLLIPHSNTSQGTVAATSMVWRVRVGNQTAPYSKEIKENMCSLFHETETNFFSFARGARLQVHATPVVEISKQIHSTASVLHLSSAFDCKLVTIEIKWCTVLLDSYCSWERYGTRGPVFERRGMAGRKGMTMR